MSRRASHGDISVVERNSGAPHERRRNARAAAQAHRSPCPPPTLPPPPVHSSRTLLYKLLFLPLSRVACQMSLTRQHWPHPAPPPTTPDRPASARKSAGPGRSGKVAWGTALERGGLGIWAVRGAKSGVAELARGSRGRNTEGGGEGGKGRAAAGTVGWGWSSGRRRGAFSCGTVTVSVVSATGALEACSQHSGWRAGTTLIRAAT